MATQERLKEMRQKGDASNDDIEKAKREVKHWKKKMDDAGETHHRR